MSNPYSGGLVTSSPGKTIAAGTSADVDLTDFSPLDPAQTGLKIRDWSPTREKYVGASWVAKSLVLSFVATILVVLLAGIAVVALSPTPDTAERFVKTMGEVLDSLTKFATAVFAPLLAFVLGFYFSERKKD